jgi:hypothetical protein
MANSFAQNPVRVDTVMAQDYLTVLALPAGSALRPSKVTKIVVEGNITAGALTIQDGSSGGAVIFEESFATNANTNTSFDFAVPVMWRNFKVTAIPAGSVTWIYRR